MGERVVLAAPDPDWPANFLRHRDLLLLLFPVKPLVFEHMGSTAIPGLMAKPVIDMIVLVDELAPVLAEAPAFAEQGFIHRADYADRTKLLFMAYAPDGARTHHLHVHADADEVRRHLIFRDRLRAEPEVLAAYQALKRTLAERYVDDREAYSRHKTAFIDAMVLEVGGPTRRVRWDPR